jgi:hypothetical protein
MSKRVKLKLEQDGKDFGYVQLKKDIFYSSGTEKEAIVFELVKYSKLEDAYYYKVADTKKGYMDVKVATSRIQVVEPFLSVDASSIGAWKHKNNGHLVYVLGGRETGKELSSSQDTESKALYGNLHDGKPFTVKLVEADKANNKSNPELEHAMI